MKNCHLILSLAGAKDFCQRAQSFDNSDLLFGNTGSIINHISDKTQKNSIHLSTECNNSSQNETIEKSFITAANLLSLADLKTKDYLTEHLGFSLLPSSCFAFHYRYRLYSFLKFKQILSQILQKNPSVKEIHLWGKIQNFSINFNQAIFQHLDGIFPIPINIHLKKNEVSPASYYHKNIFLKIAKFFQFGSPYKEAFLKLLISKTSFFKWPPIKIRKYNILFLGNEPYDFLPLFLESTFKDYSIFVASNFDEISKNEEELINAKKFKNGFLELFSNENDINQEILIDGFKTYLEKIYGAVAFAKLQSQKHKFSCLTSISSLTPSLEAVKQFFKSENIPLIGYQHGANYLVHRTPFHPVMDFDNCDYWLSYGGNRNDFEELYPQRDLNCKIVEVGSSRFIKSTKISTKKSYDILFPISFDFNTLGHYGENAFQIYYYQKKILEWLSFQKKIKILIKPILGFNPHNFAFCRILNQLESNSNIDILDTPMRWLVSQYQFKTAILELDSTPLYDLLPYDTQIYLFENKFFVQSKLSYSMLKKRVHLVKDFEHFIKEYEYNHSNKIILSDDQFYKKYVYRDFTSKRLLAFLETLNITS